MSTYYAFTDHATQVENVRAREPISVVDEGSGVVALTWSEPLARALCKLMDLARIDYTPTADPILAADDLADLLDIVREG